jgi:hypothetical protein
MTSQSTRTRGAGLAAIGGLLFAVACGNAGDPPPGAASARPEASHAPPAAVASLAAPDRPLPQVAGKAPPPPPKSNPSTKFPLPIMTPFGAMPPSALADSSAHGSGLHPDGIVDAGIYPSTEPPFGTQGGPILSGPIFVYPIFYGNVWQPSYQSTIMSFLQQISNTSYWKIVQGYSPTAKLEVAPAIQTGPGSTDIYTELDSASLISIVQSLISSATVSLFQSNIYMVFTGEDVTYVDPGVAALCIDMGGYHGSTTFQATNGGSVVSQYVLIGNQGFCDYYNWHPAPNPIAAAFWAPWHDSVNGLDIDVAVTASFHEIAETVTDPIVGTLVDQSTADFAWMPEIGDPCTAHAAPLPASAPYYDLGDGAPYSTSQQGWVANDLPNQYLIQTMWDMNQNGCAYGPASSDVTCVPLTYAAACGNSCNTTAPNGCAGGTIDCACSGTNVCSGDVCCPAGETYESGIGCMAPCKAGQIVCPVAGGCATPLVCEKLNNGPQPPHCGANHDCN